MAVIPVVLRKSVETIIPVTIKNLKTVRNIQIDNEIILSPETMSPALYRAILFDSDNCMVIDSDCTSVSAIKSISINHDVMLDSSVIPVKIQEIALNDNELEIRTNVSGVHFVRYRKLSEVDDLTLAELDDKKLEEIDYIEL